MLNTIIAQNLTVSLYRFQPFKWLLCYIIVHTVIQALELSTPTPGMVISNYRYRNCIV